MRTTFMDREMLLQIRDKMETEAAWLRQRAHQARADAEQLDDAAARLIALAAKLDSEIE